MTFWDAFLAGSIGAGAYMVMSWVLNRIMGRNR